MEVVFVAALFSRFCKSCERTQVLYPPSDVVSIMQFLFYSVRTPVQGGFLFNGDVYAALLVLYPSVYVFLLLAFSHNWNIHPGHVCTLSHCESVLAS